MSWRDAERAYEDAVIGKRTLPATFEDAFDRYGDGVAQRYKGGIYDRSLPGDVISQVAPGEWGRLGYRELGDLVSRLAAGFRDLGVERGDRVAIFADTRMEWAQADLALLAAGAVVTTVYAGSSPRQVEYLLSDPGAVGVVAENPERVATVLEVEEDLDLEFVASVDRLPDDGDGDDLDVGDRDDVLTLGAVYGRGERAFDEDAYTGWIEAGDPDDLATLIYTSGTTGRPKGVELTHWNFKSSLDQTRRRFGPRPDRAGPTIDEDSVTVSFLPLAHAFERLAGHFLVFASGGTVAYAESPDTLSEDFAAIRPTVGTSVPRVYERIYAAIREGAAESPAKERIFRWATGVGRDYATADDPGPLLRAKHRLADRLVFSTVREALGGRIQFLVSGGGSLSPDLARLYHGMGLPILEGYGLTETAPVVSVNPVEALKIGTIGPPLADVEIRLDESAVDPADFEGAPGRVGELLVSGPNVMRGYWNRPEDTAEVLAAGWFRTGDVVAVDDDGYLTFLERSKELIVLDTGKNLAPSPIEDAFAASDVVSQCMVVGDDRKFVSALLVPDVEGLRAWADREGLSLPGDRAGLCEDPRVESRIRAEVARVNEGFESHETIKEFRLVPEEFTEENDLLTPTLKKKRRNILDRYADAVEDIYAE